MPRTFPHILHDSNIPNTTPSATAPETTTISTSTDPKMSNTPSHTHIDGDTRAKTMDTGANSAMSSTEFSSGIHESSAQSSSAPMGEKATGTGTSVFDKEGAIGKQFTTEGALGGTAQKIGGPFDKEGIIGKQFTTEGAIGGTAQEKLAQKET